MTETTPTTEPEIPSRRAQRRDRMTSFHEHLVRTIGIVVLTIAAGIGAAVTDGDVRVAMLGALAILVPAAVDSLRVAKRGKGGGGAITIVLLAMGLVGCGGADVAEDTGRTAVELARVECCVRLEDAVIAECEPDCTEEDRRDVEGLRRACDTAHGGLQ